MKSIAFSRIVSLSHTIRAEMPLWPGDPPVEFRTAATVQREGYYLRGFCMGEHSGTHVHAPCSFDPQGKGMHDCPAESLVRPGAVIDVRGPVAADSDYALTVADVLEWEKRHGRIAEGSLVLLHTGWQARWASPEAFFNADAQGVMHFPGFAPEAAAFLADERQIAGIGSDTHGVDPGRDGTFATNRLMASRGKLVLENLANLDQLPPVGITLVVGALPLENGSGSPAQVLAFVP